MSAEVVSLHDHKEGVRKRDAKSMYEQAVRALRYKAEEFAKQYEYMLDPERFGTLTKRERGALTSNTGSAMLVQAAFELCLEAIRCENGGDERPEELAIHEMTSERALRLLATHCGNRVAELKSTDDDPNYIAGGLLDDLAQKLLHEHAPNYLCPT